MIDGKAPSGVTGLEEITGGGFPRSRATLIMAAAGSGKTIMSLQFRDHTLEPGKNFLEKPFEPVRGQVPAVIVGAVPAA